MAKAQDKEYVISSLLFSKDSKSLIEHYLAYNHQVKELSLIGNDSKLAGDEHNAAINNELLLSQEGYNFYLPALGDFNNQAPKLRSLVSASAHYHQHFALDHTSNLGFLGLDKLSNPMSKDSLPDLHQVDANSCGYTYSNVSYQVCAKYTKHEYACLYDVFKDCIHSYDGCDMTIVSNGQSIDYQAERLSSPLCSLLMYFVSQRPKYALKDLLSSYKSNASQSFLCPTIDQNNGNNQGHSHSHAYAYTYGQSQGLGQGIGCELQDGAGQDTRSYCSNRHEQDYVTEPAQAFGKNIQHGFAKDGLNRTACASEHEPDLDKNGIEPCEQGNSQDNAPLACKGESEQGFDKLGAVSDKVDTLTLKQEGDGCAQSTIGCAQVIDCQDGIECNGQGLGDKSLCDSVLIELSKVKYLDRKGRMLKQYKNVLLIGLTVVNEYFYQSSLVGALGSLEKDNSNNVDLSLALIHKASYFSPKVPKPCKFSFKSSVVINSSVRIRQNSLNMLERLEKSELLTRHNWFGTKINEPMRGHYEIGSLIPANAGLNSSSLARDQFSPYIPISYQDNIPIFTLPRKCYWGSFDAFKLYAYLGRFLNADDLILKDVLVGSEYVPLVIGSPNGQVLLAVLCPSRLETLLDINNNEQNFLSYVHKLDRAAQNLRTYWANTLLAHEDSTTIDSIGSLIYKGIIMDDCPAEDLVEELEKRIDALSQELIELKAQCSKLNKRYLDNEQYYAQLDLARLLDEYRPYLQEQNLPSHLDPTIGALLQLHVLKEQVSSAYHKAQKQYEFYLEINNVLATMDENNLCLSEVDAYTLAEFLRAQHYEVLYEVVLTTPIAKHHNQPLVKPPLDEIKPNTAFAKQDGTDLTSNHGLHPTKEHDKALAHDQNDDVDMGYKNGLGTLKNDSQSLDQAKILDSEQDTAYALKQKVYGNEANDMKKDSDYGAMAMACWGQDDYCLKIDELQENLNLANIETLAYYDRSWNELGVRYLHERYQSEIGQASLWSSPFTDKVKTLASQLVSMFDPYEGVESAEIGNSYTKWLPLAPFNCDFRRSGYAQNSNDEQYLFNMLSLEPKYELDEHLILGLLALTKNLKHDCYPKSGPITTIVLAKHYQQQALDCARDLIRAHYHKLLEQVAALSNYEYQGLLLARAQADYQLQRAKLAVKCAFDSQDLVNKAIEQSAKLSEQGEHNRLVAHLCAQQIKNLGEAKVASMLMKQSLSSSLKTQESFDKSLEINERLLKAASLMPELAYMDGVWQESKDFVGQDFLNYQYYLHDSSNYYAPSCNEQLYEQEYASLKRNVIYQKSIAKARSNSDIPSYDRSFKRHQERKRSKDPKASSKP